MCLRMGSIVDLDLDIDTLIILMLFCILYFLNFGPIVNLVFLLVNNKSLYGLGKVDGSSGCTDKTHLAQRHHTSLQSGIHNS